MTFEYMLAPLEDMTGNAFRTICHKYGADLTFTPMAKIESLAKRNASTWTRLDFNDSTPTSIQLIGAREMFLSKFLKTFEPSPGFIGFNLNLGCPSQNIISAGHGCAMVKRIAKTKKLLKIISNHGYNSSIKLRTGLNRYEKEKKVYLNLINSVDAEFFILHARYGTQTYESPPDFSVYEECVKTGKRIIANGDIKDKSQIEFLKGIGVEGAMIGRAAVNNPAIFDDLKGISHPPLDDIFAEFMKLSESYQEPYKFRKNIIKHIQIPKTYHDGG
ncbi:MAG: tRNA-dihydrouridine synthase family protein [Nanoarchaeota archaeon]